MILDRLHRFGAAADDVDAAAELFEHLDGDLLADRIVLGDEHARPQRVAVLVEADVRR